MEAEIAALKQRIEDLLKKNNADEQSARDARAALRGRFQDRVGNWIRLCFGAKAAEDKTERTHRLVEEVLELAQAAGCTADEAHQLVDYVFGRPVGNVHQEIGGTMLTLAGFCTAHGEDMLIAAETELTRVWNKIDDIRKKQAAKPAVGPLPGLADLAARTANG